MTRLKTFNAEYLRSIIDYDQDSGVPRWRVTKGRNAAAGAIAGGLSARGYWCLMIDGRSREEMERLAG